MATNCKDCDARIDWKHIKDRWVPLDPATGSRHRCELPRTCGTCEKPFTGATWMKECPDCYRASNGGPQNSTQAASASARQREQLQESNDDDVPF